MKDKQVNQWMAELGTRNGKYGGGSAASVVGAIATRLAQYVYELQQGKKKYADKEAELQAGIIKAKRVSDELLDLAELDADIFEPVMALFKLPKDTEEERKYRREQLDQGFADAARPPLDIMKKMADVMDLFEHLLELEVRGSILDDIAVGLIFTHATIESEKVNCETNLYSIHAEDMREALILEAEQEYGRLIERSELLQDTTKNIIENNR